MSISDVILIFTTIVTAIILLFTALIMKKGNKENARLNRLQSVENTILKQIEFHTNLLRGININIESTGRGYGTSNAPTYATGQEAFEIFYDSFKTIYMRMPGNSYKNENDIEAEEHRIQDSFKELYNEFGSHFGNYFKNLYLLVKYINDKKIQGFEKEYYIDLVKSLLSKYEILLLAYDCIWIQDKPKGENFIEYAKNTNLLSSLETNELIQSVSKVQHIDIFQNRYGIIFKRPMEFHN